MVWTQLLDDDIVARKIFKIHRGQSFRLQHLGRKLTDADGLALPGERTEHLVRRRGCRIQAGMDAQVGGLLEQEQADVGFLVYVLLGHIGVLIRPGATLKQVRQFEFIERLLKFRLRDFFPVDGTKIAARASATAALRRSCAPVDERDDRQGDDDHPEPF